MRGLGQKGIRRQKLCGQTVVVTPAELVQMVMPGNETMFCGDQDFLDELGKPALSPESPGPDGLMLAGTIELGYLRARAQPFAGDLRLRTCIKLLEIGPDFSRGGGPSCQRKGQKNRSRQAGRPPCPAPVLCSCGFRDQRYDSLSLVTPSMLMTAFS